MYSISFSDPSIEEDGITWPPFQSDTKQYLDINMNPEVKSNFLPRPKPVFNDYTLKLLNLDNVKDKLKPAVAKTRDDKHDDNY